jgi:hypothetical protein
MQESRLHYALNLGIEQFRDIGSAVKGAAKKRLAQVFSARAIRNENTIIHYSFWVISNTQQHSTAVSSWSVGTLFFLDSVVLFCLPSHCRTPLHSCRAPRCWTVSTSAVLEAVWQAALPGTWNWCLMLRMCLCIYEYIPCHS